MRALCGVPAGAQLAGAARFVSLRAPPATAPLVILVDAKARLRDLRHHAIAHLHHNGITDTDLFGIAVLCGEDYLFPELGSKLSKYAPKSWRASHTHGLDGNGRPLLELYLRVQFHVDAVALDSLGSAAKDFYLQYLREESSSRSGSLAQPLRTRLRDISHSEEDFLVEACAADELNSHCYRLRASKREEEPGSIRLYVRASGLMVAPDTRPPAFFPWPSIGKLSFDRKKFEIRAGESRITLYSSSDDKSKLLLSLCRETHLFSLKAGAGLESAESNKNHQRTSVISFASSNTTSGVVSDRVQSEDEPEMPLDSPPMLPEDSPTVASETSGVYTMTSSALPPSEDGQPIRNSVASDCTSFYNEGSYMSEESAPFRGRADSTVSAAASFRGDGSDPTDRQHGPLSAEELTHLIVGRTDYPPLPQLPGAFTHAADSDSDYLTLLRPTRGADLPSANHQLAGTRRSHSPPPPVPPKRMDSAKHHMHVSSLPNILDVDQVDGPTTLPTPPPPYTRTLSTNLIDMHLSESLRELQLGIPIKEPPPYPGRVCPAKYPPSSRNAPPPPPPPPAPLTVYSSQLARSQIEQYTRQLHSDVDYVVYPLQDPAISHQDYLDSKALGVCPAGGLCRGTSTQALSDTYIRLPQCATTSSASRRIPPPPPISRTVSDDNILTSLVAPHPKLRRLPPPPPPPAYPRRPPPSEPLRPKGDVPKAAPIDIKALREKSKNLDLPLIAALCNDKSLLKQTKAFVMPRHGMAHKSVKRNGIGLSVGVGSKGRRGCHRHPGDALPELPVLSPRATNNTYVPDPHTRSSAMA